MQKLTRGALAGQWNGKVLAWNSFFQKRDPGSPLVALLGSERQHRKALKKEAPEWKFQDGMVGAVARRCFLSFFFPFIFISCRLITLQYCSGFCHTLTWISHGFTCVPHPEFPSHQEGAFKSYSSLRVSRPKWPKVMVATLLTGLYWGHWIPKHSSLLQKVQNHQIRGPNPNPDHMKDKRRLASDSDCSQGMKDAVEL